MTATDDRAEQISARLAAATPGPWKPGNRLGCIDGPDYEREAHRLLAENQRLAAFALDLQGKVARVESLAQKYEAQAAWCENAEAKNLGQEWDKIERSLELRKAAADLRAALGDQPEQSAPIAHDGGTGVKTDHTGHRTIQVETTYLRDCLDCDVTYDATPGQSPQHLCCDAVMGTRPHVEVSEIEYALDNGPLTRGDVGGVWDTSRTTENDPGVGALTPTSPRGLTTHHLDITERGRLLKW